MLLPLLGILLLGQEPELPRRPVATYSIVARDAETGEMGVAVQSHWFSVGSLVTWAEAGVGAVATQSFAREAYGPELLADLREGIPPGDALANRTQVDPGREVRQIGVVDASGRAAAFTGEQCIASAGHLVGDGFAVQANIMVHSGVVPAMKAAYLKAEGPLAERLLRTLEVAQLAGGDARGKQSAALLVVSGEKQPEPWQGVRVDLRVDDHPEPLRELRRLYRVQQAYRAANEGDEHLAAGDAESALHSYARAEELYPEQVELSYWRAVTLLQEGDRDDAFALLREVFAADASWTSMAPRLVEAGHLEADEALLREIASLAPSPSQQLRWRVGRADAARIEADIRKLASFGTRHTMSETQSDTRGIGAARRWLAAELERISQEFHGGRLQVELAAHAIPPSRRLPDGAEVVNPLAVLPGRDPDRLLVISGHYDSRNSDPMDAVGDAPGANDDASGTAAVLEAARLLGGVEPEGTVVFMAVAGEEQGLHGARAQAQEWTDAGKTIGGFITMDIVGGATGSSGLREPMRLRVFSEGVPTKGRVVGSDNDAASRQLARYLKRAGEAAVPGFEVTLIFRQDRYLRGGDHKPFFELGWPAVRLTEPHENYDWQHQDVRVENGIAYGDIVDNVDFDYVTRVTQTVTATLGELALAPGPPQRVRMDTSGLTPHTRLFWEPSSSPTVAGYAVVYRRTHEPDWTHRQIVGDDTEITLDRISKDDWLFGVEAYDQAGHRSLPIYPTPGR